jgi:hypothetical protein
VNGEFTIEYVELPNGRVPAREFVNSLDDKAAARTDAFIERLRVYATGCRASSGCNDHSDESGQAVTRGTPAEAVALRSSESFVAKGRWDVAASLR